MCFFGYFCESQFFVLFPHLIFLGVLLAKMQSHGLSLQAWLRAELTLLHLGKNVSRRGSSLMFLASILSKIASSSIVSLKIFSHNPLEGSNPLSNQAQVALKQNIFTTSLSFHRLIDISETLWALDLPLSVTKGFLGVREQ